MFLVSTASVEGMHNVIWWMLGSLQLGQTTIMASEVIVGASLYKQDRLDVPVPHSAVCRMPIPILPVPLPFPTLSKTSRLLKCRAVRRFQR